MPTDSPLPEGVQHVHDFILDAANFILSEGGGIDPMAFVEPSGAPTVVSLDPLFGSAQGKEELVRVLRGLCIKKGATEIAMVSEATIAEVDDPENLPETAADGIDPHDVVIITIEREGQYFTWIHKLETLEGGSRVVLPASEFIADFGLYNRWVLLPGNVKEREVLV